MNALLIDERSSQKSINRSRRNHFSFGTANCHLANFKELGNPFHQISNPEEINGDDTNHTPISTQAAEKNKAVDEIYNLLESFCGSNNPTVFNVVPQCLLEGVLKWVSRLLMIMQKLPPVTEDACKVFRNIFDLYTTTCFRVCSGSSKHESILLGVKAPKTNIKVDQPSRAQGASSPLFGFRRRSSSSIPKMSRVALTLSAYAEAELCAPLPCEMESLACLRDLILTAQANLQGIAKLDLVNGWIVDPVSTPFESQTDAADKIARTLEKRLAASWSCLFLAAVLRVASVKAKKNLKTSVSSLDSLESYVDSFMKAAPVLVSLSNRISCIRSIDGKGVLQEVRGCSTHDRCIFHSCPHAVSVSSFLLWQIIKVGSGWEEAKLHEHPNNYVDVLCDLIALVWASLSKAGKLPNGALKLIWGEMLAGGYMTLLDGFSRVPFCSTEGRALMSMDLASYSSGTSPRSVDKRLEDHDAAVSLPPTVTILRGMSYVDTYIKVFYFPPKVSFGACIVVHYFSLVSKKPLFSNNLPQDAIGWIEENHEAYLRNHLISLIVGAATSSDEDDSLSVPKLVDSVKKLYRHYSAPDGYYDEDATSSSGRLVKV